MSKGRPIKVEWQETENELYALFAAAIDVNKRQKLQFLWLVRTGNSLRKSSQTAAINERTGQRYLKWYREGGVENVLKRQHGGDRGQQASFLTKEQQAALKAEADAGKLKTVWEGIEWVKKEYEVEYSYEGMRGVFKRLRLKKKVPRKQHIKSDPQAQDAWKKGGLLSD
jgi:transposase